MAAGGSGGRRRRRRYRPHTLHPAHRNHGVPLGDLEAPEALAVGLEAPKVVEVAKIIIAARHQPAAVAVGLQRGHALARANQIKVFGDW